MTTIAIKGGKMAADSLMTDDNLNAGRIDKTRRLSNGDLVGLCGEVALFEEAFRCAEEFITTGKAEFPEGEYSLLHLSFESGKIFLMEDGLGFISITEDYCAMGSGAMAALVAMDCGRSAAEAVQCAIDRDIYSGGPIKTLDVSDFLVPEKPICAFKIGTGYRTRSGLIAVVNKIEKDRILAEICVQEKRVTFTYTLEGRMRDDGTVHGMDLILVSRKHKERTLELRHIFGLDREALVKPFQYPEGLTEEDVIRVKFKYRKEEFALVYIRTVSGISKHYLMQDDENLLVGEGLAYNSIRSQ